jgi:methylenetetrahydrofolate reductase (NADPH)
VRPIYWAIKPKSYVQRTQEWDEYPNGRWGVSRSAAFGEQEGMISIAKKKNSMNFADKQKMWGTECTNLKAISVIFQKYLNGKLKKYPFSEGSLAPETNLLRDLLLKMNQNYMFTINSQPRVNGDPSTSSIHGWGPKNGFIYQKAYVEFFIHPQLLPIFTAYLDKNDFISYEALNKQGDSVKNVKDGEINAVTWGVFKGSEILQPTVVDNEAFTIWKDEAFSHWCDIWGLIYGIGTPSYEFLKGVQETFYLINIVDNNYISGDLPSFIMNFINTHKEEIKNITP